MLPPPFALPLRPAYIDYSTTNWLPRQHSWSAQDRWQHGRPPVSSRCAAGTHGQVSRSSSFAKYSAGRPPEHGRRMIMITMIMTALFAALRGVGVVYVQSTIRLRDDLQVCALPGCTLAVKIYLLPGVGTASSLPRLLTKLQGFSIRSSRRISRHFKKAAEQCCHRFNDPTSAGESCGPVGIRVPENGG